MKDWNEVLEILEVVIEDGNYIGGLNTKEIELIMSILKDNIPFNVVEK